MKRFFKFISSICNNENPAPRWLEQLAQGFAALTAGTDCRCCLGARIAGAALLGFLLGTLF